MPEGSLGSLFTEGWGCDPTWIVVCPGASQQLTDGWGQVLPKWPPPEKTGVNVGCCEGRTLKAKLSEIFISVPFSGGGHFGKIWPHPSVSAGKPQGKQQSRWDHSAPQ